MGHLSQIRKLEKILCLYYECKHQKSLVTTHWPLMMLLEMKNSKNSRLSKKMLNIKHLTEKSCEKTIKIPFK